MDAVRGAKISSEPIYISQGTLRFALLEQLGGHDKISGDINWLI
jgi:hypothetical protein